jgi:hypothetical protein
MGIDPCPGREFLEEGTIKTARGAIIDILDGSLMAQLGVAKAGGQTLVMAMTDLALEEEGQPLRMGDAADIGIGL